MNWTRIIAFGLGAYVASEVAGAIFEWPTVLDWRMLPPVVATILPIVVIMGWFAVVQSDRRLLHISLGAVVAWLPGFVLGVMAHPFELIVWVSSFCVLAIASGAGLGLGMCVAKLRGSA